MPNVCKDYCCGLVSPYDGQFSLSSLRALNEVAGIDVLAKLAEHQNSVLQFIGMTLKSSQQRKMEECATEIDRLEVIIDFWRSGEGSLPPTWKSFLAMLFELNLDDLRRQIEDYFG